MGSVGEIGLELESVVAAVPCAGVRALPGLLDHIVETAVSVKVSYSHLLAYIVAFELDAQVVLRHYGSGLGLLSLLAAKHRGDAVYALERAALVDEIGGLAYRLRVDLAESLSSVGGSVDIECGCGVVGFEQSPSDIYALVEFHGYKAAVEIFLDSLVRPTFDLGLGDDTGVVALGSQYLVVVEPFVLVLC